MRVGASVCCALGHRTAQMVRLRLRGARGHQLETHAWTPTLQGYFTHSLLQAELRKAQERTNYPPGSGCHWGGGVWTLTPTPAIATPIKAALQPWAGLCPTSLCAPSARPTSPAVHVPSTIWDFSGPPGAQNNPGRAAYVVQRLRAPRGGGAFRQKDPAPRS